MARTGKSTEDVKESASIDDMTQENIQLRGEVDELKKLVKQLLENQKVNVSSQNATVVKDDYYDIEEELNINPHRMVKIVSMVLGGLNLKGMSSKEPIYLPDFGSSIRITFEDLRAIYNNHGELARNGAFFIVDKLAVKALYLEDEYDKLLSKDKIENIIDLNANEIVDVLKNATKLQKETVLQRIVKGIPSGDNRYNDWNKIKAISDAIGQDLMELAKEISV